MIHDLKQISVSVSYSFTDSSKIKKSFTLIYEITSLNTLILVQDQKENSDSSFESGLTIYNN